MRGGFWAVILVLFTRDVTAVQSSDWFQKCVLERANKVGGSSWVEQVRGLLQDPSAVQYLDLQRQLASDLNATLDGFVPPKVEKTKEGGQELTISLVNFNPMMWLDPKKKREKVREICGRYYRDLVDFCTDAFFKKEQNIDAFLLNHRQKLFAMADQIQQQPKEDPVKFVQGYEFRTDTITRGNLLYGQDAFLSFERFNFLGPVRDDNETPIGMYMTVETNGVVEKFFAPFAKPLPALPDDRLIPILNPILVNPYFFVFGGVRASEWNGHWKKRYGALKYQGKDL